MASKRGCPLFKGAEVIVEDFCFRCGHFNKETTACDQYHNTQLLKKGFMKQADYDKKHENMGVS